MPDSLPYLFSSSKELWYLLTMGLCEDHGRSRRFGEEKILLACRESKDNFQVMQLVVYLLYRLRYSSLSSIIILSIKSHKLKKFMGGKIFMSLSSTCVQQTSNLQNMNFVALF